MWSSLARNRDSKEREQAQGTGNPMPKQENHPLSTETLSVTIIAEDGVAASVDGDLTAEAAFTRSSLVRPRRRDNLRSIAARVLVGCVSLL